jgi:deoxyribodipyrimidine photo-lyase
MDAATAERVGCRIGVDYHAPLVEPAAAAREAKDRIWAIRREAGFDRIADAIQQRHGSRRAGLPATGDRPRRRRRRGVAAPGAEQLQLDL